MLKSSESQRYEEKKLSVYRGISVIKSAIYLEYLLKTLIPGRMAIIIVAVKCACFNSEYIVSSNNKT